MARSTPRPRIDLSTDDGDGPWTLVERRRRKAPLPAPPSHREYKLLSHQELNEFQAIKRLELDFPDATFRIFGSSRTGHILRPQNEETAFILARLAREGYAGINLEVVEPESRGIVMRYPLGFSLEPILDDARVTFARRCTYNAGHGRKEPTRQVLVRFGGKLPDSIDLGSWGVFAVRKYVPEPPRCFNCQAFGHVRKHCGARQLCAVCSGRHPTSECVTALKNGEARAARCPNCGLNHHAWSKSCDERRRRLPPESFGRRPTHDAAKEGHQPPPPAAPATTTTTATETAVTPRAAPTTVRRRRRGKKRAKATARVETAADPTSTAVATPDERTTADVSCQTEPMPPPAVEDAAVHAVPATSSVGTQTEPLPPEPAVEAAATQTAVPETRNLAIQVLDLGTEPAECDQPDPDDSSWMLATRRGRRKRNTTTTASHSVETPVAAPARTTQPRVETPAAAPAKTTQPAAVKKKMLPIELHYPDVDPLTREVMENAAKDPAFIKLLQELEDGTYQHTNEPDALLARQEETGNYAQPKSRRGAANQPR